MRPTTLITIVFASLALAAPHGEAADSHEDMARATREEATPWSVPADSPPPSTPPASSPPAEAPSPPAKSPPPEASPSEDSQHYDHVMMSHNNGYSGDWGHEMSMHDHDDADHDRNKCDADYYRCQDVRTRF